MNLLSVLFVLIIAFAPLSFTQCAENSPPSSNLPTENSVQSSSKLPKEMPAETAIRFNEGGGMVRSYKSISIAENFLDFEELKPGEQNPTKWTAKISPEDQKKLYRAFVANEFDLIKNDERKGVVYDAGSESISLTVNNQTYNKAYGANSPMSGDSQKHYQAISAAINNLADLYATKGEKLADNYAVLNYEPQRDSRIFDNAAGTAATLSKDEIAELAALTKKAIDEHNRSVKSAAEKINLSGYKFQYLPAVTDKNEKLVFVNSFCSDFNDDWRNQLLVVDDGGKCFFNLKINLSAKKYFDLMVNGVG